MERHFLQVDFMWCFSRRVSRVPVPTLVAIRMNLLMCGTEDGVVGTSEWRYGQNDPENLGGTARTLDDVNGRCDLGHGVVSKVSRCQTSSTSSLTCTERNQRHRRYRLDAVHSRRMGDDSRKDAGEERHLHLRLWIRPQRGVASVLYHFGQAARTPSLGFGQLVVAIL